MRNVAVSIISFLLKGWSSSPQHKRYAEVGNLESQIPPLYNNSF